MKPRILVIMDHGTIRVDTSVPCVVVVASTDAATVKMPGKIVQLTKLLTGRPLRCVVVKTTGTPDTIGDVESIRAQLTMLEGGEDEE